MVKKFGEDTIIYSWMRNRNTVEFLGIWEQIHNPSFKGHEFVTFKTSLVSTDQAKFVYTSEADVLNVAIFGTTAKE